MEKKNENRGIISFIKQNIIYALMFFAIISAILFSNYFDQNVEKNKVEMKIPYKEILIIAAIIFIFIIVMITRSNSYLKEVSKPIPVKSFTERLSKEEYEKVKKETTERELAKLMHNPKFRQMVDEKGDDPKNWIWQTKEKEKKTVWRDEESCDEDEHLSQITVSDDD